jgi:deoxyribonuclease V
VIETRSVTREVKFPYIPGLLSFREVLALLAAFAELRPTPDVVMLEGEGIAHSLRLGLSCRLVTGLDVPCLDVTVCCCRVPREIDPEAAASI